MWSLLFLILTLPLALSSYQQQVITVNRNGSDDEQCLEGLKPCQSLGFAARIANRSVLFRVDGKVPLHELVTFQSTFNVTIVGVNPSELVCPKNCTSCGLEFLDTQSIVLQNITITGCSVMKNLSSQGVPYQSAVILHNCKDIALNDVTVQNSRGYGTVLINSLGDIKVSRSYFVNNTAPCIYCDTRGGAGMLILVSSCDILNSTCNKTCQIFASYEMTDLVFSDNSLGNWSKETLLQPWPLYYGGGLGILLSWGARGNRISITNSTFSGNQGPCGAGLSIRIDFNSIDNTVLILGCNFTSNTESQYALGGAGAAVGIASGDYQYPPLNNKISFEECHFSHNSGYFGAGTLIYSSGTENTDAVENNTCLFTNCSWEHNSGVTSPAIHIEPDFRSTLEASFILKTSFSNCKLINNTINSHLFQSGYSYHAAPGVLLIIRLKVYFFRETVFQNNEGTALMLFSASALFGEGAVTSFTDNTGGMGGALVLFEFASLRYWNHCQFSFTNNRASTMGGAIYVFRHAEHQIYSSHTCFIGLVDYSIHPDDINVHFYFTNNSADTGFANSMFVSKLEPCQYSCMADNRNKPSPLEIFNQSCLGYFHFLDDIPGQIGTEATNFNLTESPPLHIIPGREYLVPMKITDELGNDAINVTVFQSSLESKNASLDPAFRFVTNNKIVLEGDPGSNGSFILVGSRSSDGINVPFQLAPCAPGYVSHTDQNGMSRCVCSSIGSNNRYLGVTGCNDTAGVALVAPGIWVGYVTEGEANEDNLFTGFCVHGYCRDFGVDVNISNQFKLLSYASKEGLERLVCSENRQGPLCGKCSDNHSVYYHSSSHACQPNSLCKLGPLFYILSELIPTAILFSVIIFFDISLTNGYAYSITFMLQMLQAMGISLVNGTPFQDLTSQIALMIYSTLNLDFFSLEQLSFCLWAGAGALDMLVMKYATVLFVGGLVVCTILLVNHCNCCQHRFRKRSFVQGLTAFLVICYSQCTLVAFYVLSPTTMIGKGGRDYNTRVVYFDGSIPFFSAHHLLYAIPALLVLVIIVIPLPVILFCDPFLLKLEYKINRCCRSTRKHNPWTAFREKFKPLFDSFQGCFKDDYRFTSGLFFIYRIVFLSVLVASPRLDWFYGLIQFVLLLLFTIQALMQPFKETGHNVVAVLVFFDLTGVNCCSIIIYMLVYGNVRTDSVYALQWIQLILLFLPLLCGLGWCGWKFYQWLIHTARRKGYLNLQGDNLDECLEVSFDHSVST